MTAYLIIEAHITDPQGFGAYARATPDVAARYGGRYLVMGGVQQSLEGEHAPARTVISQWPDRAAALAFWHSADYAAIKPLRAGTGNFRVLLADGVQTQALNDTAPEGKVP
ncbi:MAG: DUF1330 domain-containing protein [Stenotrophomonas sp.]